MAPPTRHRTILQPPGGRSVFQFYQAAEQHGTSQTYPFFGCLHADLYGRAGHCSFDRSFRVFNRPLLPVSLVSSFVQSHSYHVYGTVESTTARLNADSGSSAYTHSLHNRQHIAPNRQQHYWFLTSLSLLNSYSR